MRIAVFFGGKSSEREISILSAVEVIRALRNLGHDVFPIEVTRGLLDPKEEQAIFGMKTGRIAPHQLATARLSSEACLNQLGSIDMVFIALHGGEGENGTIQGELEQLGIPFTGSSSAPSALAMNKHLTKKVYRESQIPTAEWQLISMPDELTMDFPLIVKPNQEGSSAGVSLVEEEKKFLDAFSMAQVFEPLVMVESYIQGDEYTVGVLGKEALSVGGIYPKHAQLFDYSAKYQEGATAEIFPPADINETTQDQLKAYALKAHQVLELSGYSRSDFIINTTGTIFTLETNTLPGLTKNSLLPKSANASGMCFEDLIQAIIGV